MQKFDSKKGHLYLPMLQWLFTPDMSDKHLASGTGHSGSQSSLFGYPCRRLGLKCIGSIGVHEESTFYRKPNFDAIKAGQIIATSHDLGPQNVVCGK